MNDNIKLDPSNIRMAQDEELQAAIRGLSDLMERKQYDFLLLVSERLSAADSPKDCFQEGMSVISYKSELPVMPAILFGVGQRSRDFEHFITDFIRLFMELGRKVVCKMMRNTSPDGLAN